MPLLTKSWNLNKGCTLKNKSIVPMHRGHPVLMFESLQPPQRHQSRSKMERRMKYFVTAEPQGDNALNSSDHEDEMVVDGDRQNTRSEMQEPRIMKHNETTLSVARMTRAKGRGKNEINHSIERENMSQASCQCWSVQVTEARVKRAMETSLEMLERIGPPFKRSKNSASTERSPTAPRISGLLTGWKPQKPRSCSAAQPDASVANENQASHSESQPTQSRRDEDDEVDVEGDPQGEDPMNVNKAHFTSYDPDATNTLTSPFHVRQVGRNTLPSDEDNDSNNGEGECTGDIVGDNGRVTCNHSNDNLENNIQDPPMHLPTTTRTRPTKATGFKVANGGVSKPPIVTSFRVLTLKSTQPAPQPQNASQTHSRRVHPNTQPASEHASGRCDVPVDMHGDGTDDSEEEATNDGHISKLGRRKYKNEDLPGYPATASKWWDAFLPRCESFINCTCAQYNNMMELKQRSYDWRADFAE
ncbi:hypothetical protein EDD15DRAFT_2196326 [Pisolithus albus]|nr:hypothetical protein EDD15DRAFT_2196326 [Pisolithus albus]